MFLTSLRFAKRSLTNRHCGFFFFSFLFFSFLFSDFLKVRKFVMGAWSVVCLQIGTPQSKQKRIVWPCFFGLVFRPIIWDTYLSCIFWQIIKQILTSITPQSTMKSRKNQQKPGGIKLKHFCQFYHPKTWRSILNLYKKPTVAKSLTGTCLVFSFFFFSLIS